jgi:tRNA-splicing ligase RtcB
METGSFLLVGTEGAMRDTFASTMHGAGRTMSRAQAKKSIRGEKLQQQMKEHGILVQAVSVSGLAEEAELRPIGNIKG